MDAARRRGIPVRRLNDASLVRLGTGRHQRRIQAALTGATSWIGTDLAQDKDATKRLLEGVGLPTPGGTVVERVEDAVAVADRLGYPVLLKPVDGNHGRGVSGRLEDETTLRLAWRDAGEQRCGAGEGSLDRERAHQASGGAVVVARAGDELVHRLRRANEGGTRPDGGVFLRGRGTEQAERRCAGRGGEMHQPRIVADIDRAPRERRRALGQG